MYLRGKSHKFISTNECVIYAEKKWNFGLFDISKIVKYKCEIINYDSNYNYFTTFKYFKYDGESIPVNDYEKFSLDSYNWNIIKDLNGDKILKDIRKQKLEKIENENENAN